MNRNNEIIKNNKKIIIKKSLKSVDIGQILNLSEIHDLKKTCGSNDQLDYFNLSEDEARYFKLVEQHKRIEIYQSGLFNKINQLEKYNFYRVGSNDKSFSLKFVSSSVKQGILYVQFYDKNGLNMEIAAHLITLIEPHERKTSMNKIESDSTRNDNRRSSIEKQVQSEFKYLQDIQLHIIDPYSIRSIENGKEIRKYVLYKRNSSAKLLNVKWKGIVNKDSCLGCELTNENEYGTNGQFLTIKLFHCSTKKGVLIPVYKIHETCEWSGDHNNIVKMSGLQNDLFHLIECINSHSICCAEWLDNIKQWPRIQIGSRIKYSKWTKDNGGICKWMGLINGKEAVGVEMDKNVGEFDCFDLFSCQHGRGVLLEANEIIHFLPFEQRQIPVEDRVFQDININSAVKYYYTADNEVKDLYGTVRWTGVNEDGKYLYGIELDDRLPQATDGQFKNQRLFSCSNGYGILAELNCVTKDSRFVELKLIRDIYISNTSTLDELKMMPDDQYVVDELVTINDEIKIHGRVQFSAKLPYLNEQLIGVLIVSDVKIIRDHSQIMMSNKYFPNDKHGMIVKRQAISKIDKTLKYINNSPVIDLSCVVIFEENESDNLNTGDVVKYSVNNDWLFGRVIRLQLLNGIPSVEMKLINFDKDMLSYFYVQQDQIQIVTNIQLKTNFFNGNIIDPSSVISIDKLDNEEWKIDDNISFRMRDSYERVDGCLKWIGKVNDIHTAAVELQRNVESLNQFGVPNSLIHHMSIISQKSVILVTLSGLNSPDPSKSIEIFNKYFIKMYMSTNDVNIQRDFFNDVTVIKNKSILRPLIGCISKPINIDIHQDLISNLIIENDIESIKLLLENCINGDNSSSIFLNLAKFALSFGDDDLFSLSVGKCSNKNATLSNGETFLTNLFKENLSESVINEVIGQRFFDVNVMNNKNESPVMLACQKLMVSTVEKIVHSYPILSNHRNKSLSAALEAQKRLSELNRSVNDVLKITHLLHNAETQLHLECNICLDKHANVAFQCGHVVCDLCSFQLFICPTCSTHIQTRTKIYI